ncbi:MAG TPA: hypothetical protein GXX75_02250 [Clostridiales bacterium]|nr:hypothetical protein [Clostridiales bacterium]
MEKVEHDKVLQDENGKMQFDFSKALSVFEPHTLASMYSEYLSDVDFVVEDERKLICLEYKNANIKNADNPQAFQKKIEEEPFWKRVARKFYGTMFLVWACNKNQADKPVQYVLLMETNLGMDEALKKRLIAKLLTHLPFSYRMRREICRHVIDEFLFVDLEGWKAKYPQYPISYIETGQETCF